MRRGTIEGKDRFAPNGSFGQSHSMADDCLEHLSAKGASDLLQYLPAVNGSTLEHGGKNSRCREGGVKSGLHLFNGV